MRGLVLLLLACLAIGAQSDAAAEAWRGQQPTPEDVADVLRRLESREPAEAAWGAYLAAEGGVRQAAPLLVKRLREQAVLAPTERSFALRTALLDAIIALDLDVDAKDLLPHAEGLLLPAVVVCLARRPDRYAANCLSLFEALEPGARAWLALGNALAAAHAPGFAASVLRGLELRLTVRVWTLLPPGGYREPSGSVCGCGFIRARPEGFPPTVVYRLRDTSDGDAPPLADGPRPVYFARYEYEDGEIWTCSSLERGVPPHAARVEWLAAWGVQPTGFVEEVAIDHRWTGVQPYVREVSRKRDALVSAWKTAVQSLASSGLLAADDRVPSAPPVLIDATDHRTTRWTPRLPPVPPARLSKNWLRFPRSHR